MMLFDWQCKKCENVFEELVAKDDIPKCPKCNSITIKQINVPKRTGLIYPMKYVDGSNNLLK